MSEVVKVLQYIKDNPKCTSKSLNYDLICDLHNSDYIEGINTNALRNPSFLELRLNIRGQEYLNSLKRPNPEDNSSMKNTASIPNDWHNKPIGKIFVGTSIIVLAAIVLFVIKKHFGITL